MKELVVTLFTSVGLTSCTSPEVTGRQSDSPAAGKCMDRRENVIQRLDAAQAKWEAAHIDNYSYRQKHGFSAELFSATKYPR